MKITSSKFTSQMSREISKIHRYSFVCAALWTLVLSGLYAAYFVGNREAILEIGRLQAQVSSEKDVLFRRWAARHGGVYAPVTPDTPANPYLKNVPERDITTPSGRLLTLINPAYMTRQIFELARETPDFPQGHITSLKPIRPENAPDSWEVQALKKLELGAREVVEPVQLNGQPYLRFMRPLVTEKPCLRCHAAQGYKEGDGRGGISVTISLVQITKTMNHELLHEALIHSFIWLLGLGFLWYGTKRITRITQSLRDDRNSLLESEQRFRSLADTAPVLIWIADQTKGCTYFNKVWCDFTGREHHELIGNGWASDVHPDDLDQCIRIYESSFDARKPFSMEYRLRRHDGEYRWIVDIGVPRWLDETNFIGYIGSCIDISDRKRSEFIMQARIELSEYALKHTMDELLTRTIDMIEVLTSSSIGFFHFLDEDQRTLKLQAWSSHTLSTMCTAEGKFEHYSVDEAGVWVDCIHQRRPVIHNDYAALPDRKGMPQGHAAVVRELVVPVFRGDQIVAILGVGNKPRNYAEHDINAVSQMANLAWDIVIAKQAEDALRKSEEQSRNSALLLQSVIEHFPGVVFWKNNESVYIGCNRNFSDGAGLSNPEDIAGKTDFDLPWADTEAANYRADDRTVIESGTAKLHIIETQHQADNQVAWFDTCKVPLRNQQNTIFGVLGASFEITAIKRAEEERLTLQQQLHHAQRLESLGVLAGGIAHDFNNILTVILGRCFIARENIYTNQEYQEFFLQIETAGHRAADLCRQMLTYAGKSPIVQTHVNLWLLVDEVVKMLQSGLNKNVTIELDLKRVVPEIKGDTGQVQQIIMNLIINAAESIGDKNGTIRVALSRMLVEAGQTETDVFGKAITAGGYICLEVTDSGCGMDTETQSRIFEPFYTTKFTGRGLGMSAIRGIITSHEALLFLTSTPGVGTSFRVCFPAQEPSDVTETASTASPEKEVSPGTVLLVDDEQTLRDMGIDLLNALGFKSLTASNGREALEMYRKHRSEIDVILLDLIMPVMAGIEAYHELRTLHPTIPIIFCSGYNADSVEQIIENDQQCGFVHKPYKPTELREMMIRMMRKSA